MSFPCNNPCVVCPPSVGGGVGPVDPANPYVNLSSETPDVDNFIGRRYSIGLPPLGSTWYAVGCVGFCLSDESQQAADLCAAQQAVLCQSGNWPVLVPGVVPGTVVPQNRPIYSNSPQQCSFTCPDGSIYTFTVAAGIFSSVANQATADLMAYSYACNKAVENHMCLGTLTPVRTCSGANYEGTVTASTSNTPVSFSMVTPLPDGLLLQQTENSAFIHGTPTTPGDYAFTIRATDSLGQSVDKILNLSVFGISTSSPLPPVNVGDPYSETLQYGGTPSGPVTWSLVAGVLPTGVTLNPATGELSGTPTNDGVFLLTIRVTDGVLSCSKNLALTVNSACDIPATLVWTVDFGPDINNSAAMTVSLINGAMVGTASASDYDSNFEPSNSAVYQAQTSFPYLGPGFTVRFHGSQTSTPTGLVVTQVSFYDGTTADTFLGAIAITGFSAAAFDEPFNIPALVNGFCTVVIYYQAAGIDTSGGGGFGLEFMNINASLSC